MPIAAHDTKSTGGYEAAAATAGKLQITSLNMPVPLPPTIAASPGNWKSGVIFADGYQVLSVAVQMTTAGTLIITRYLDGLGAIARTASSTAIVANTLLIVDITDDLPFLTFQIEIDNGAAGVATITSFTTLLNAD
jgi:hypothetical protein